MNNSQNFTLALFAIVIVAVLVASDAFAGWVEAIMVVFLVAFLVATILGIMRKQ